MANLKFEKLAQDGRARLGRVTMPRGEIMTPVFMPVGTAATVKAMWPGQLRDLGTQISLANTYHLYLQPGESLVEKQGGLHKFMAMEWPLLTDSGGFQVFSLPKKEISEDGVRFAFEKGGEPVFASPEWSMRVQMALGADIVMAFDECAPYPCSYKDAKRAAERTTRWLDRCVDAMTNPEQNLFGIVQGSVYEDLRELSAEEICARNLPGVAVGGVSVGEGHKLMMKAVDDCEPVLPSDKPRYLMGVGLPEDIVGAVGRGMDMFDCVIPTRYGRSGTCFTSQGRIRITNPRYRNDHYPLDPSCDCTTCQSFSRAYLHHLVKSGELLGTMACTLHNIAYYHRLMSDIRAAIREGRYADFADEFDRTYVRQDRERRRKPWREGMFRSFAVGWSENLPDEDGDRPRSFASASEAADAPSASKDHRARSRASREARDTRVERERSREQKPRRLGGGRSAKQGKKRR